MCMRLGYLCKYMYMYNALTVVLSLYTVSAMREKFVSTLPKEDGGFFSIRRSNIYGDVLDLFKQEVLSYYPLMISFVDERALLTVVVSAEICSPNSGRKPTQDSLTAIHFLLQFYMPNLTCLTMLS